MIYASKAQVLRCGSELVDAKSSVVDYSCHETMESIITRRTKNGMTALTIHGINVGMNRVLRFLYSLKMEQYQAAKRGILGALCNRDVGRKTGQIR